jgi:hypothetical protein
MFGRFVWRGTGAAGPPGAQLSVAARAQRDHLPDVDIALF